MQRKSIPKSWGRPPTPPHTDNQSSFASNGSNSKRESYLGPDSDNIYTHVRSRNLSRANSVYSISRVSFTNQITQLTSIQLPEASSLSGSISAIPTAPKAAQALSNAADQIQAWINKASEVLDGLDARDDVEWAAEAGREGVGEVDGAINKFDSLIKVYVTAVEKLQMREDADTLGEEELQKTLTELEKIINEWQKIKDNLNWVKKQVELAMEWQDLRNTTFEDITSECEKLSRQIFEMEEQRHKVDSELHTGPAVGIDLAELEALMENRAGSPNAQKRASHRYSFPLSSMPTLSTSPSQSPTSLLQHEDTNLLGIFARMQPLRSSLDFIPVRLSKFQTNASHIFPTACQELEEQRQTLEDQWSKLQADAESLKRELGEDRWLLIFRNSGKQALGMLDSVARSITKLDEALDSNTQLRHAPATLKKIENYEAKKQHYCPAIERVIAIVDRGVKDRLTVNGEIIRLQNDVQSKWQTTLADVKNMDSTLEFYDAGKTQQLRESVSSMISNDNSFLSSHIDSTDSSPPSSVGIPSRGISRARPEESITQDTPGNGDTRPRQMSTSTVGSTAKSTTPASKRYSSLPVPVTPASVRHPTQPKTPVSRSSAHEEARPRSSLSPVTPRSSTQSPSAARPLSRLSTHSPASSSPASNKPRWNVSTSLNKSCIGHNFRPLAATEPSPYRKVVTPIKYTPPGASRRQSSLNPLTPDSALHSRRTSTNYTPPSARASASPSPALYPRTASRARRPSSLSLSHSVVSEAGATDGSTIADEESPTNTITQRPESVMTDRSSKLPQPPIAKTKITSAGTKVPGKKTNSPVWPTLKGRKSVIGANGGA